MNDRQCVPFLQWALPRLQLRWQGFRKVRRQVCKRIRERQRALGLATLTDYRALLEKDPTEWPVLDGLCRVTISRFHRDREVFDVLGRELLPELAGRAADRPHAMVRVWSIGCASGEEPYGLVLTWRLGVGPAAGGVRLSILATDSDLHLLRRAQRACYEPHSLKDLPPGWRRHGFRRDRDQYCLEPQFKNDVQFVLHDIRTESSVDAFDLVLCRNLVFTYFDEGLQREVLARLWAALRPRGYLLIGAHEAVPGPGGWFAVRPGQHGIYRRLSRSGPDERER